MYLTGFADEAAPDIQGQIRAIQALGWKHLEARNVDGVNLHDLPQDQFDRVCDLLGETGISVNCFGSAIANWGCQITDPFDETIKVVDRTIPRMEKLGTKLIRIMSYAVLPDRGPEDQMEDERFRRLRVICGRFLDAGITPVHENCMNYGGMGWRYTLRMLEQVPGLKLVFDTGNPCFTADYSKPEPRPRQSSWEFYSHVREHIAYIHIKDCCWDAERGEETYTWPGEGDGDVKKIVGDLLTGGYEGGFSMEPHLGSVFHRNRGKTGDFSHFDLFVEYGQRFENIYTGLIAGKLKTK